MRDFDVVCLSPPGPGGVAIPIAASRAGALGVLDLWLRPEPPEAARAVAELARYGRRRCGLRLDPEHPGYLEQVTRELPGTLTHVVLTPCAPDVLREQVQLLHSRKLSVALEVVEHEEALLGEEVGVDVLIAKGHEAGGRVGEETTFILLQRLLARVSLPIWAQGGIGLHTAPGCCVAGAAGVVLDSQLLLTRESPLPEVTREAIGRMDGSETTCLGRELGDLWRVYERPNARAALGLRRIAAERGVNGRAREEVLSEWRQAIRDAVGWGRPEEKVWLLGQDAAFAAPLAREFRTVGGVVQALRRAVETHVRSARRQKPLDQGSPLARAHGTTYPIVQGPMTRVSDRAAFALEVAKAGGLPFLALALMRGPEVATLLEETRRQLGERPWGVGILGFVPLELRDEQMEVIRVHRPAFALIAGGRPDQALALERDGIPTYLHVPSPGLLQLFVDSGSRRFVFEGRECGGHVGPRSSFVLWNTMIDTLLETLPEESMAACHVLFAGGVHDDLSAAMVAAMAAPLAERGARVGVLLGSAYLFTHEAVASGAIVRGFQEAAVGCRRTVLLESGPGHATRCALSPFSDFFERERQRLLREGRAAAETRVALETLNLGRLRVASKGVDHNPGGGEDPRAPRLRPVTEEEQRERGMYMIGQVAALRDTTCSIAELHADVAVGGTARLVDRPEPVLSVISERGREKPSDVAVVGMGCLLPKAPDVLTYWNNILAKVDAITEVPADRWDWRLYYDAERGARDKVYSRWGGFLDEVPFDPMRYGMPPSTLPSIEPLQLLTLEVARAALTDAGYLGRPYPREHTSVILGAGGGVSDLGSLYAFRSTLPLYLDRAPEAILARLPEWTEDSFAGVLLNVAAGRVANRFDLGGINCTVDAACASSLAAIYMAVKELETGTSDMVIAGGVDTAQNPFTYLCFSKTRALSPSGRCRTFDEGSDGIAISEGLAAVVLKRLEDAERDGDRIYAVIKAISGSSDGRDKGLTAPRPEGQMLALERAYAKAGFGASTVGLVEAHGTGTVAGDRAEVETLTRVFGAAGAQRQACAIGSVKSMIGHTKCTAGVAGLMKVALALHHKVLPPTLNVERPDLKANLPQSPFFVNTDVRPWLEPDGHPRRAGVSAFGFGGTNFHAVLEEYTEDIPSSARPAVSDRLPSELCVWHADSRGELLADVEHLEKALGGPTPLRLADLAFSLWKGARRSAPRTLAVVASTIEDLRAKLAAARESLASGAPAIADPRGIYFTETPLGEGEGRVAFLFPGQGSQYPGMLRDLAARIPDVRLAFERADRALRGRFPAGLSRFVFPPPAWSEDEEREQGEGLTATNVAQPALGAADLGMFAWLDRLGVRPAMLAGHSYGEYAALCAASVFDEEALAVVSEARGRSIVEAATEDLGTMAAVSEGRARIEEILGSPSDVWIANLNSPRQTVLSGTKEGIARAVETLGRAGIQARPLTVACAFHSPLVAPARDRLSEALSAIALNPPRLDVYSNTTAAPYPRDPAAIGTLLADHLVNPVRFAEEIEAMYQAGARVFVEVGPRNILTGLVRQTLDERAHLAVASDVPGRESLLQTQHLVAQLLAHGVPVDPGALFDGRTVVERRLETLGEETESQPSATLWRVSGGRARPAREATAGAQRAVLPSTTGQPGPETPPAPRPNPLVPPPAAAAAAASVPTSAMAPTAPPAVRTPDATGPSATPFLPSSAGSAPAAGDAVSVMVEYQRAMARFLEAQQEVMMAYLQPGTAPLRVSSVATGAAPTVEAPLVTPTAPTEAPTGTGVVDRAAVAPAPIGLAAGGASGTSAPPPSAPSPEPAPAPRPAEEVEARLLRVVSERTGYPAEMLHLDLRMEADLGIDSIKRVEILGAYRQACPAPEQEHLQGLMETLSRAATLRSLIEGLASGRPGGNGSGSVPPSHPAGATAGAEASPAPPTLPSPTEDPAPPAQAALPLPRFLLRAVDTPVADVPLQLPTHGVCVVTDDETGVAAAVAATIDRQGGRAVLVRDGAPGADVGSNVLVAPFAQAPEVARLVDRIREQHGPIAALVHLRPLRGGASVDAPDAGWRAGAGREAKALYHLVRAVHDDLTRSPGGLVLAASALGGDFGVGGGTLEVPGQGGVSGLVKVLALEWPGVRCRTVDVDPKAAPETVASWILQEMSLVEGEAEVGRAPGRRRLIRPVAAPLADVDGGDFALAEDSVVLVTGGARGITALVAQEMARRYRPTLVLVGRSPLPASEEDPATAGIVSMPEVKAALLADARRRGGEVTPARIEAAYSQLRREREIRATLRAIEAAGSRVSYHALDVRDAEAVGAFLDELYRTRGRLDGVIHGAGVIEDKLIVDKAPESFDRVFDTKVDGAFALARHLHPEGLRFLAFFSSVAGRWGNRGQGDYGAANEVLNKLAIALDRRWPGRVVAVNWGPWAGAGMASSEVQRQFADRGVALIRPEEGPLAFLLELERGGKGEVEVVLGAGPWGRMTVEAEVPPAAAARARGERSAPLLRGRPVGSAAGAVALDLTLDPSEDLYLADHVLDGKPVFPAAMAMELMSEVAQRGWPDLVAAGLRDFRVLRGVVLDDGPRTVRVVARAQTHALSEHVGALVDVEIVPPGNGGPPSYRGTVVLADRLPDPPSEAGLRPSPPLPLPMSVEDAYRRWLFHGPLFAAIGAVEHLGPDGVVAELAPSSPRRCLRGGPDGEWLIDPVVVDAGFQLAILWSRTQHDLTPLPSRFESYRRFGPLGPAPVRCHMTVQPSADGHVLVIRYLFVGPDGGVLGLLEGLEANCSKALNRLSARVRPAGKEELHGARS
jgi:acyl transferase domain-containing protein/NAD(P)H-dependent flavin oxidoreductase YrpB (nitropropane dioxygenase family)/short-subunit dehydrogenase